MGAVNGELAQVINAVVLVGCERQIALEVPGVNAVFGCGGSLKAGDRVVCKVDLGQQAVAPPRREFVPRDVVIVRPAGEFPARLPRDRDEVVAVGTQWRIIGKAGSCGLGSPKDPARPGGRVVDGDAVVDGAQVAASMQAAARA